METIVKRNGDVVPFDESKITEAVRKAILDSVAMPEDQAKAQATIVTQMVLLSLGSREKDQPNVEEVQDAVENALMDLRMNKTAKAYILYREEHQKERARKENTMNFLSAKFLDITSKGVDSEVTKGASGNANVDTESPMGKMCATCFSTSL